MKLPKVKKLIEMVVLSIFICAICSPVSVSAHPGNTSADGGHYCWTNCEYWGYEYGTRHFHGGGGSSFQTYSPLLERQQAMEDGEEHANEVNLEYIEENAEYDGEAKGYSDGRANQEEQYFFDEEPSICEEVKFTSSPSSHYREIFLESYRDECKAVYNAMYETAYLSSFDSGKEEYDAEQEAIAQDSAADMRASLFGWGALSAIIGIVWGAFYLTSSKRY